MDNHIIRERIGTAVDTNLAAKGYSQVDPAKAKLLVSYHVGLQNKTDYSATRMGGPGALARGVRGCIGGHDWRMNGAPMLGGLSGVAGIPWHSTHCDHRDHRPHDV